MVLAADSAANFKSKITRSYGCDCAFVSEIRAAHAPSVPIFGFATPSDRRRSEPVRQAPFPSIRLRSVVMPRYNRHLDGFRPAHMARSGRRFDAAVPSSRRFRDDPQPRRRAATGARGRTVAGTARGGDRPSRPVRLRLEPVPGRMRRIVQGALTAVAAGRGAS